MHSGSFYTALSMSLPIVLVATAVAGRSRWPATAAAGIYMVIYGGVSWLLMLFPAVPKLGPIYRDITHYVPLDFPLLLVLPAFAMDMVWRRVRDWRALPASAAMGAAFFHIDNFVYWQSVASEAFAYRFRPAAPGANPFAADVGLAFVYATIASLVGLLRGHWMTKVRR